MPNAENDKRDEFAFTHNLEPAARVIPSDIVIESRPGTLIP
jgi:hypothetical protein